MKTIIAGGRDYILSERDFCMLDTLHQEFGVTEVVSGKARGADTGGEEWAKRNQIPIKPFPAAWKDLTATPRVIKLGRYGEYNSLAGHNRNEQMAQYADALIVFPGGSGTADMLKRAKKHKLKIIRINQS